MLFLVNPTAGRGAAAAAWPPLEQALREAGVRYQALEVRTSAEAARAALEAAFGTYPAVVAVGGDGTVHGTLNGLMEATAGGAGYLPLGIIAVGRTNRLAAALELPLHKPIAAIRALLAATTRFLDVGLARSEAWPEGERYFATTLGIGLEAFLLAGGVEGATLRTSTLLQMGWHFRPVPLTLTVHGRATTQPLTALTVVNGGQGVAGLRLNPQAQMDDGQLDLCVVRALPRREVPSFVRQGQRGTHIAHRAVTITRAAHLSVSSLTPFALHLDGVLADTPVLSLEVEVLPRRLAVLR